MVPHQRLSGLYSRLKEEPLSVDTLLSLFGDVDQIVRTVPVEDKPEISQQLVQTVFDYMGAKQEAINYLMGIPSTSLLLNFRSVFLDFTVSTLEKALQMDKKSTQAAVYRYTQGDFPIQRFFADLTFGMPEMRSDDMNITLSGNCMQFEYFGRKVQIKPPIEDAVKAREISAGLAVLVEDGKGKPLAIVHTNLLSGSQIKPADGITFRSSTQFTRSYYYGAPTSLKEIQACLNDKEIDEDLKYLLRKDLNPSVLPLHARVRLRSMYRNPKYIDTVRNLCAFYQKYALSLFQLFNQEDVEKIVRMLNYLEEKAVKKPVYGKHAEELLEGALFIGEFTPGLTGEGSMDESPVTKLIEAKVKDQIEEAILVYQEDTKDVLLPEKLADLDWQIVADSMMYLGMTARAASALAEGREFPFEWDKENMPVRLLLKLFEFSARHPKAKTIFQTYFDFVTAVYIARQESAPYAGEIRKMKETFYSAYLEMNQRSPTTEPRDIDRTKSLIVDYVKGKKDLRLMFGGCGNCQRFEGPLLEDLREEGIEFVETIGVDITDKTDEIPDDLEIKFMQADLTDEKFVIDEPVDILVLPWSMINDIVMKKNMLEALQIFKKIVKKGGLIIFDTPLPVGKHSYAEIIEEQADSWGVWGIMERDFKISGGALRSIFDIMHLRELTMHLLQAGLVPTNLKVEFDEQQRLCQKIAIDDTFLAEQHESGVDRDAVKYPVWQTAGGYNRLTLAVENVGEEEVLRTVGLAPSVLISKAFSSPRKG